MPAPLPQLDALEDLLVHSADPPSVATALAALLQRSPALADRLAAERELAARLVAVLGASRSLTRLVLAEPAALEVLAEPARRRPIPQAGPLEELVRAKRLELARIAALDLTGAIDLEAAAAALSHLAAEVAAAAHHASLRYLGAHSRLAVIGMGKLGAGELNYASDIDLVMVGEGDPGALERAARSLLEVAGRCFRVDANLRPEGRDGPLVRSLASYQAYWDRWAEAWERQALLKAAPLAGDAELGDAWWAAAQQVLWERSFTNDDLRELRAMKERAEQVLAGRGGAEREVKRGPGGIRDVEFSAQLLQLVHGRVDPELRERATLPALGALAAGGYVDADDAATLSEAYRFLRRVEHALQLRDEQQTHSVPEDPAARSLLARVLGYRGTPRAGDADAFDADLAAHRARVRTVHQRVWFRPLLAALAGAGPLRPEALAERLAAFGFADAERTRQAVLELTRGLTRSSRMMQQLLPLLLGWLSSSPDPDLGLLGLRRLVTGEQRSRMVATAFRESPEAARRLALLVGTSRLLADILVANPDLIERLPDPRRLATEPRAELVRKASASVLWRATNEERQPALRRWLQRNLLGVAARDVLGHAELDTVGDDLSALAEAVLEVALSALAPAVPFAVVALGRFGGTDLGYASDLDVVFVHDGGQGAHDEAERVAAGLRRFVEGETPSTRLWELDTALRPEGRQGPISRSLEAWTAYLDRWAETWERQAHLRARHVAGDPDLGDRLVAQMAQAVHRSPLSEDEAREIRRMKARIERERIPPGEDPEFHLKLGKGGLADVEFTVQLLQLRHGVPGASTLPALAELAERGHLPAQEAAALAEAYRFCDRVRNRRYLVAGPGDALPTRPEQMAALARSLEMSAASLREEYRRLTRRARWVVQRRFYEAG